ncbi:MAG: GNAT family N-acetyltransferase [Hydrogenophaga sp.]|nr:GNAT family N-acetyltransferase [Hydrogenophaga sp.]
MLINDATPDDLAPAVGCLAAAFAHDPITGYLLHHGPGYPERVTQFLALLMRARLALHMPVLVARQGGEIQGSVMGYTTARPDWPDDIASDWLHFEHANPGLTERLAIHDTVADSLKPTTPHYYLGVIGVDPDLHGQGLGRQLLQAYCDRSAADPASTGVYLETANPANVNFYENAGFVETGRGMLGDATLCCLFLPQERG